MIRTILMPPERGNSSDVGRRYARLVRAVLDEVCTILSPNESGVRAHVASTLLEAATGGETTQDELELIGRTALSDAPTMWRSLRH